MFVWVMLIDSWLILIALPPLSAAQIMLLIDRFLGGHFFDTQAGGSAVLWQHFFWIFGHPEVYILIFPAFAILSRDHSGVLAQANFRASRRWWAPWWLSGLSAWVCGHTICLRVGMTSWSNTFFAASTMLVGVRRASRFSIGQRPCTGGKTAAGYADALLHRVSAAISGGGINRHHAGGCAL